MKKLVQGMIMMLVMAVILLGTSPVHAQSNGLGITPRKDYTVKAGQHISDRLFISNLSQKENLQVSIRIVDFRAQDETGTPALELAANAPQTPWSLKPFIKIANKVTVPAGQSTYLPFTVDIPAGQGAGSYYSAVEYVAENAETQQKVTIAASTASLIFVTVPGKAQEQLLFKQFGAYAPAEDGQTGTFKGLFIGEEPKMLAYRLQNKGNVAEQPQGTILVKNIFGKTVKTIPKANPKNQLALRDQTRRFETCIEQAKGDKASQTSTCKAPGLWPGRYTAQLAVLYGLNGNNTQEVTATAAFWYLPWWSVAVLLIILIAIIGGIWMIYRKRRGKQPSKVVPKAKTSKNSGAVRR